MRNLHLLFLLFILHGSIWAQESTDVLQEAEKVKSLLQGDAFNWGGQLNLDMRFNTIQGIERRADPFDIRINGTVFASIYNVKTALNINMADGKIIHRLDRPNVKLPAYAYLGMSPSYKWAKIHLGYRSIPFTPYTFNGTNFYGAGIELSPGHFRLKTFYGRLQRASPLLPDISSSIDPTFFRIGAGIQAGYQKGTDECLVSLFYAKDDPLSIEQPILRLDVTPMSNLISSIHGKKALSKNLSLDWNYAWSGVTRNINAPISNQSEDAPFYMDYGGLFTIRNSTGFHKALQTGINLTIKSWLFDLRHERIDPGYRSLGSLFFNNDFENVTSGIKKSLWKQKIQLSGRIGLQRNNLQNTETNTIRRIVGQLNSTIQINKKLNMGIQFSNFSNTNILRTNILPFPENDSLILTQVNRNLQLNASFIQGKNKHILWTSFLGYQQFNTIANEMINIEQKVDNIVFQLNNSYRFLNGSSLNNAFLVNHNINEFSGFTNSTLSHTYTRPFLKKKLKTSLRLSNSVIYMDGAFSRHLIHIASNSMYQLNDQNEVGVLFSFVRQTNNANNINSFREFNCRIRFKTKI